VYLGKESLVEYKSGTTYFIHADHLGSARLVTNVSGGTNDSMDFLPYGEQIAGNSGTNYKFTGQERDSESGLDYFKARHYASRFGSFMTPDPLGMGAADLMNPQSLNQYAYVMNNPLNTDDPSGMDPWDEGGFGGFGGGGLGGDCIWCEGPSMPPPIIPNWSGIPLPGPGQGPDLSSVIIENFDCSICTGDQSLWDFFHSYFNTLGFLVNFLTGTGPTKRTYGPQDYRSKDLKASEGIQQVNDQIKAACARGQTSGGLNVGTGQAAANIPHDVANSPVGGQVGGYNGTWVTNGDTTTLTIHNDAGAYSFFYHKAPNNPFGNGPLRTINQTFNIQEPNPCATN
jgi:RHS repeat-associated protein